MRKIRTYAEVQDFGSEEIAAQVIAQRRRLEQRLSGVGAIVAIASGKGGVGKSAVTANLAATLAARGRAVGCADADLNGPSLARMLGARGPLAMATNGVLPARGAAGVQVVSMDLLLASEDAPLRWREPAEASFVWQSTLETGAVREMLADVAWSPLDFLLIDIPPGTDKLGRILGLVPRLDLVLLVTTPSEAARAVVVRAATQLREFGEAKLALVANMASYVCAECGSEAPLFSADGARKLAEATDLPIWAEIPFDPRLASETDAGRPFVLEHPDAVASRAFSNLADEVERQYGTGGRRA